jgi:hypothetical protein
VTPPVQICVICKPVNLKLVTLVKNFLAYSVVNDLHDMLVGVNLRIFVLFTFKIS